MAGLPILVRVCPHCQNVQYNALAPLDIPLDDGRMWGKRCSWYNCQKIIAVVGANRDGTAPLQRSDTLTDTDKAYLRFYRWVLAVDRRRWKDRESPERPYPLMVRPKE